MTFRPKPPTPVLRGGHPLARGLISCYPFHERAGDTFLDLCARADVSITSHAGANRVEGEPGAYYDFDGTADVTVSGHPVGDIDTSITVAAWVRDPGTSGARTISCAWGASEDKTYFLGKGFDSGNPYTFVVRSAFSTRSATLSDSWDDDDWHLLVGRYAAGGTQSIIIDGGAEQVDNGSGLPALGSVTVDFQVANGAGGSNWNTGMASLMIWDRPLADDEIYSLYADPWALITPSRTIVVMAPAGGVTVVPTQKALNFTVLNPTVTITTTVPVAQKALNLTKLNPAVTPTTTVPAAQKALNLTVLNPTVTIGSDVTVPVAQKALNFTVLNPTVTITTTVPVALKALDLTKLNPAVTPTTSVPVAQKALNLTVLNPTVTIDTTVTVPVAQKALNLTVLNPTVTISGATIVTVSVVPVLLQLTPFASLGGLPVVVGDLSPRIQQHLTWFRNNLQWDGTTIFNSSASITAPPGDFEDAVYERQFTADPDGRNVECTVRFFNTSTKHYMDVYLRATWGHEGINQINWDKTTGGFNDITLDGVTTPEMEWGLRSPDGNARQFCHSNSMFIEFRVSFTDEVTPTWDTDDVPAMRLHTTPPPPFFGWPAAPAWVTASASEMMTAEMAEWASEAAESQFYGHRCWRPFSGESGQTDYAFGWNNLGLDNYLGDDTRARQWRDLVRNLANKPGNLVKANGDLFNFYDEPGYSNSVMNPSGLFNEVVGSPHFVEGPPYTGENYVNKTWSNVAARAWKNNQRLTQAMGTNGAHWSVLTAFQIFHRYRDYGIYRQLESISNQWLSTTNVTNRGGWLAQIGPARAQGRRLLTGVCSYYLFGTTSLKNHLSAYATLVTGRFTSRGKIPETRTSQSPGKPTVTAGFELALEGAGLIAALTLGSQVFTAADLVLMREQLVVIGNHLVDNHWYLDGTYKHHYEMTWPGLVSVNGNDDSGEGETLTVLQWMSANEWAASDPRKTKADAIIAQEIAQGSKSATEWPQKWWRWLWAPLEVGADLGADTTLTADLIKKATNISATLDVDMDFVASLPARALAADMDIEGEALSWAADAVKTSKNLQSFMIAVGEDSAGSDPDSSYFAGDLDPDDIWRPLPTVDVDCQLAANLVVNSANLTALINALLADSLVLTIRLKSASPVLRKIDQPRL